MVTYLLIFKRFLSADTLMILCVVEELKTGPFKEELYSSVLNKCRGDVLQRCQVLISGVGS